MKDTNGIRTKEDFVSYVYELSQDYRNNPDTWENNDLGSYLEALAAWVDDMDGYYINTGQPVPEKPTWLNIADILLAAKVYE